MDNTSLTIPVLREKITAGALRPRDLVDQLAARIAQVDPKLKAYLHLDVEKARAQAETADIARPLGGIPVAIKDVINVQGDPCTCASKILSGYTAPYDATVITKLRDAGAVLMGRTNMDEFAMGSSTENSSWGVTRNPWDLDRIPGGSSGGSAAAVGGHEAFAALGTDTGGSIRQPAPPSPPALTKSAPSPKPSRKPRFSSKSSPATIPATTPASTAPSPSTPPPSAAA
jgi:aspartyl-tRNA(Asn)/glutamyl-tRNA(Gln) amidotransferase subunit A